MPQPPSDLVHAPHPAERPRYGEVAAAAPGLQKLTDGLNPAQREAVEHRGSPLLIVAGAGSGKTRVLTRRIAHLLRSGEAMPGEILAITFTNKAAAEMRERVGELVGPVARSMWVSTFHSACVRILRRDAAAAGLKSSFTIYDSADSLRLITTIAKDLELDTKKHAPRALASRISTLKNDLVDPIDFADQAESAKNPFERTPRPDLHQLHRAAAPGQRGGLRRPHRADRHPAAGEPRDPRGLPPALPSPPGGRVPGHQHRPVPAGARTGGG